jgi:hypothetical protein
MANRERDRTSSKKEIVHAIQQHGEPSLELDLQREVTAILATAGWKVLLKGHRRPTKRFGGDILASRTELGRERRYAVECVLQLDGQKVHDYFSRFRNWVRQSKEPFKEFDEFWLIGQEYTDKPPRNNPGDDRHFRALDLNELRALFVLPRRERQSKARTKIGKAVEANNKEIQLAVAGLILQINAKIEALGDERPNSDVAITRRDADIAEYKRMRAELEQIQTTVADFKKGTEKEANVVRSLKTFADGVRSWWNKAHDTILTKTFDMDCLQQPSAFARWRAPVEKWRWPCLPSL